MYGNGYGGGNGLFGSDATMLLILFLFAFMGNGWGGFGGGNNGTTFVANDVQRGFDQSAVMGGINALNTSVNTGFSNAEVAACNRAMDAMQTAYGNQIADLERSYTSQTAQTAQLIADNTAQTQYVVNRIAPYPQAAYIVPNPYGYGQTCGQNFYN